MFEKRIPEIDVDKLMQEIREERHPLRGDSTASRAASTMSTKHMTVDLDDVAAELTRRAPRINPPAPVQLSTLMKDLAPFPEQGPQKNRAAYHLTDFGEEDTEFVLAAYRAILKREADVDGLHTYSEMLRNGATKAEILYRIEQSPEGRLIGTEVGGIKLPYLFSRLSRLPVFGRVFSVVFAIWNLPNTELKWRRQLSATTQRIRRNEEISVLNAKATIEALRRLEYSQNALSDMTRLLASKTQAEALQIALCQTIAAVQALQQQTSTHVDKPLLDEQINALWAAAEKKVDKEFLEAGLRQYRDVAETKVDRSELQRLTKDFAVSIQAIAAAKADAKEFAQSKKAIEDVLEKLNVLRESKADAAAFREFDALFLRTIETTDHSIAQMDRKTDFLVETKAERAALEDIRTEFTHIVDQATAALTDRFDQVVARKADSAFVEAVKVDTNTAITTTHDATVEKLNSALAFVNSQALDLKRNLLDQDRRLGHLLDEARKRLPHPISVSQISTMLTEEDHRLDAMYASFEDQFRGTRDDIRQRQAIYLPYVQEAKGGSADAPIIDIGCGRGEWLELLRDEGLVAIGVDLNRIFLDGCRALNLDVAEEDAIEFLRRRKPESVRVVTSFHVIEHLDHRLLIALLDETFRVLQPGGIAIFETPNPRNVVVGSCNFYLDPTHKRPLPPELSRYLLEARGFSKVELRELHPCTTEQMVSEGTKEMRDTLNKMFYSSQDYAVIGRKV